MRRRVLAVIAVVALSSACSDSPTSPTAPRPGAGGDSPYAGAWSGTLADEANGEGRIRLVIAPPFPAGSDAVVLSGTWTATFSDAARSSAGSTTAVVQGGRLSLFLTPTTPPSCSRPLASPGSFYVVELPITETAIRGSYYFDTCAATVSGTLNLRKD